jgi:type IV pilus assembly protein PilN
VILINLLPHREAARKRRKEAFFASLAAAALLGGLICGAVYVWYQAQISSQQSKNTFLQSARQQAVEDLQSDRNMPVHLLNELVKQLPDGVYVSVLKQEGTSLSMQGVAQSNERVSELLRNLANNSVWLTRPELVEIVASSISLTPKDQRRVANFSIKAQLRKPTDVQKAATDAASASVGAPAVGASLATIARKP